MLRKLLSLTLAIILTATFCTFPTVAETTDAYTPKTVEFVRTNSASKISAHASNVAFTLPDVDYYIGDTIKFSETFFSDNALTVHKGTTVAETAVTGVSVNIHKYDSSSVTATINSHGVSTSDLSYTFQSAGTYVIVSSNFYYNDGTNQYKYLTWDGSYRLGVIEVKDPSTVTTPEIPTTDETSGAALTLVGANLEYMNKSTYTDTAVKTASILGTSTTSVAGTIPAGTVLGFEFEFDAVSYINSITFNATNDNSFYMADVYGSLDGQEWYLLNDNCQISPNGTTVSWSATTFTAQVNGVAKYVKLKNFKWKGSGYTQNITGASATGFVIPIERDEPMTITLVPNAAGDKFTLPPEIPEVILGDTIVIPYSKGANVDTPESAILTIGGVECALQPLWQHTLFVYGEIGGVTYTDDANGCYICAHNNCYANAHTPATSGWATNLTFEITQPGTYRASNWYFKTKDETTGKYSVDYKTTDPETGWNKQTEIMEPFTVAEPQTLTYFYPEYPEYTADGDIIIPRDYDYEVYVNDGETETQIPVYNSYRTVNPYVARGGKTDSHRRFSEFSFDGTVTVKIKVKGEMTSYAVLPSNEIPASDTSYDEQTGIISVTLREPKNFLVRLNDDFDTILSVFAEDLWTQAEVPTGDNVITYGPGYHDPAKNSSGQIEISANQTVYLYPGAIVNARVKIKTSAQGNNAVIMGRGSFIDPRTSSENTPKNTSDGQNANMVTSAGNSNVTFKGVRFLDAHCFNIVLTNASNFLIDDVKILSAEISTDGITTYGTSSYGTVQNSFIYNNDNVFVMGGGSASNGGIQFKNNIVGSGFAVIYPQSPIPDMTVDGLDVFRMNDFYRSTVDSSTVDDTRTLLVKNVRAEDASVAEDTATSRKLIYIKSQDTAVKNITFENVALPADVKNLYSQDSTETGFSFTFKDVFLGGTKLTSKSQLTFEGSYTQSTVNDPEDTSSVTIDTVCPNGRFADAKKTASHTADPVIIIGKGFTTPYYKVSFERRDDGTVYVPVAYILKKAGYDVTVSNNGATVTASDDNTTVVLTETSASNTTLTENPELVNGVLMAPTSLMFEVYGLKAGLNADGNLLVSANGYDNLLRDGGFENLVETSNFDNTLQFATSFDWSHWYHGKYYYDTDAHSGENSVKVRGTSSHRGISQSIADEIKTYGAGTYTFRAYLKLDASTADSTIEIKYGLGQATWNISAAGNQLGTASYSDLSTTDWTLVEKTINITESDVARANLLSVIVTAKKPSGEVYFYVDDASLTFTPTETSTQTADIVPYIASADRTIYYEYDGTNAVINTAKTPSNITVKIGDRLDIRDVLMQKYPNIDLNRVTLKTTYSSGTWYQAPAVEEIFASESGTLTVSISKYYDVSGAAHTVSDTLLTVTVSSEYGDSYTNLSTYSYSLLNDTNSIIHGRTTSTVLNQFYAQGSGAEFKFTGTAVGLKVTTKATQKIIYQIDGGKEQTLTVRGVNASNVGYTYILAENLEDTTHTVKFLRSYESFWGAATISSVTPSGKWPSKPTSTSELKVQFIGDSITSGNSLENYTQNYAYLTAKALNADFQAFSVSGAAMSDYLLNDGTRKSSNSSAIIPYVYGNTIYPAQAKGYYTFDETSYTGTFVADSTRSNVYRPSTLTYDMTRFTPDVVVINLGENDAPGLVSSNTNFTYNKQVFINMYANFLTTLSTYYPNAKFVLSYGMMGYNQTVYDSIEDALELYRQNGGTNDATVVKYTQSTDRAYDNAHPGVLGHAAAAEKLATAINTLISNN